MKFLKRIFLAILSLCFVGFVAIILDLWSILGPTLEPCETFETKFGNYTLRFPAEADEIREQFGGMEYDSLPPYFLNTLKQDTLIQAHFRAGYNPGKFKNPQKKPLTGGIISSPYDNHGIYCYSFIFNDTLYSTTFDQFCQIYGREFTENISRDHRKPFKKWEIGPCHHLLLFRKKPFALRYNSISDQEYTYIMFVYNLTDKEISDVVEADGAIRNESI